MLQPLSLLQVIHATNAYAILWGIGVSYCVIDISFIGLVAFVEGRRRGWCIVREEDIDVDCDI